MMVRWLEDAIDDMHALRQFIALDNPNAAAHIAKLIIKHIDILKEQPNIGRPGRVHNTRELIISTTPYIIPYRVRNNAIEILRVFHSAMQWPDAL